MDPLHECVCWMSSGNKLLIFSLAQFSCMSVWYKSSNCGWLVNDSGAMADSWVYRSANLYAQPLHPTSLYMCMFRYVQMWMDHSWLLTKTASLLRCWYTWQTHWPRYSSLQLLPPLPPPLRCQPNGVYWFITCHAIVHYILKLRIHCIPGVYRLRPRAVNTNLSQQATAK